MEPICSINRGGTCIWEMRSRGEVFFYWVRVFFYIWSAAIELANGAINYARGVEPMRKCWKEDSFEPDNNHFLDYVERKSCESEELFVLPTAHTHFNNFFQSLRKFDIFSWTIITCITYNSIRITRQTRIRVLKFFFFFLQNHITPPVPTSAPLTNTQPPHCHNQRQQTAAPFLARTKPAQLSHTRFLPPEIPITPAHTKKRPKKHNFSLPAPRKENKENFLRAHDVTICTDIIARGRTKNFPDLPNSQPCAYFYDDVFLPTV